MKYVKNLDTKNREILEEMMKSDPSFKVRRRAHAILLSAKHFKIDQLASIFEADRDTVSEWIRRWEEEGIEGLYDSARSGRPRKYGDD